MRQWNGDMSFVAETLNPWVSAVEDRARMLGWSSAPEALELLRKGRACRSLSYPSAAAGQIAVGFGTLDNTNSSHCSEGQRCSLSWLFSLFCSTQGQR